MKARFVHLRQRLLADVVARVEKAEDEEARRGTDDDAGDGPAAVAGADHTAGHTDGMATWSRRACAAFFIGSGAMHLLLPGPYRAIMPRYFPWHTALVALSGVAEIAGGIGLLVPRARRAAGIGLVLLLIAVFPANVEMLVRYREQGAGSLARFLLWARLPLQVLLIWWVWRVRRRVG